MSTLAEKCSRPVTLSKTLVDVCTGEATDGGTFQKACGTRLASRCPSCSEVYRRDLMTVIGEGLDLDKHPGEAVHFLTLTAPGADHFGETHNRPVMRRKDDTTYVRPCGCGVVHAEGAKVLGTPRWTTRCHHSTCPTKSDAVLPQRNGGARSFDGGRPSSK